MRRRQVELATAFPKDFTNTAQLKSYGEYLKSSYARLNRVAPTEISADLAVTTRVTAPLADAASARHRRPSAEPL